MARILLNYLDVRILIVDDDKLIRWVLQEICVSEGHDVTAVAIPESASQEAGNGSYDIIFVDLETEAIDAATIIEKLKVHQPKASVILLSSRTRQEIEPLLNDIAIYGIVGKPFEASLIRSFIDKIRDRKRERGTHPHWNRP